MLKNLLYLFVLLAGFPTAYFLSYLCEDEIKSWEKRLLGIAIVSLIIGIGLLFTSFEYKFPVVVSLLFIVIVNLMIVVQVRNKK